mgnify:CR=1 FL=1
MELSRIQKIRFREIWKHEAHDFTTWLENNIDVLTQAITQKVVGDQLKKEGIL